MARLSESNKVPTVLAVLLALALPFLRPPAPGAVVDTTLERRASVLAADYEALSQEMNETKKLLERTEMALAQP